MITVRFEKWHGLGNDFVVVDAKFFDPATPAPIVAAICDRRRGIGADGILVVTYEGARPRMVVRNADGSRPEMCGNGLRCFARYLTDAGLVREPSFIVETASGLCPVWVDADRREVRSVTVDMGTPDFRRASVPMARLPARFVPGRRSTGAGEPLAADLRRDDRGAGQCGRRGGRGLLQAWLIGRATTRRTGIGEWERSCSTSLRRG